MAEEVLYIGIDLGTFRSVMVSSDSHEEEELTVIGTPKDPIARNFLKRDVLFGNEALKNGDSADYQVTNGSQQFSYERNQRAGNDNV